MNVHYKRELDGVNWGEMKATLREDSFDNGRTETQYKLSFENSFSTCIAYIDDKIIGTARVLSDGVGNAYAIDVWTLSKHRRKGIATRMMELLIEDLQGQHLYLQTDNDTLEFYVSMGFNKRPTGMNIVIGDYLKRK